MHQSACVCAAAPCAPPRARPYARTLQNKRAKARAHLGDGPTHITAGSEPVSAFCAWPRAREREREGLCRCRNKKAWRNQEAPPSRNRGRAARAPLMLPQTRQRAHTRTHLLQGELLQARQPEDLGRDGARQAFERGVGGGGRAGVSAERSRRTHSAHSTHY